MRSVIWFGHREGAHHYQSGAYDQEDHGSQNSAPVVPDLGMVPTCTHIWPVGRGCGIVYRQIVVIVAASAVVEVVVVLLLQVVVLVIAIVLYQ